LLPQPGLLTGANVGENARCGQPSFQKNACV